MESVKPLDERGTFEWEYDSQADVLYISQEEPREAIGVSKSINHSLYLYSNRL